MNHSNHKTNYFGKDANPCTDKLTDIEYLKHMVPHHQVAIDMSNLLAPNTNNPIMKHLCRNIIRTQSYEIWEMNMMIEGLPDNVSGNDAWFVEDVPTKSDIYHPITSKSKEGPCNPLFFKPNDHSVHMKNMKITDKSYLEHMIPHHQVAIDMSKRLLKHTNNNYLLYFCRKLINDQQVEILYMNNLLRSTYNHNSVIINE